MRKLHIAVVALLLAVAAVLGTMAATRTVGVATTTNDAAYRARVHQLNAAEAKLRRALAAKPAGSQAAPATITPRVIYRRPAPIVITRHTHRGDDGFEAEGRRGGGDD